MSSDPDIRNNIRRVTLFEHPGVPEGFDFNERQPWFKEVRARVVEFLGAPNMINTRHQHIAGSIYRVKKDHCLKVDGVHALRCVLGTASGVFGIHLCTIVAWGLAQLKRAHHWGGISNDEKLWIEQLAHYEKLTDMGHKAWSEKSYLQWVMHASRLQYWNRTVGKTFTHKTRSLPDMIQLYYEVESLWTLARWFISLSSLSRSFIGLTDELAWTAQQHNMEGFWRSFKPGKDLPSPQDYLIVRSWPCGVGSAAWNLLMTCGRGLVPCHPAAPGIQYLFTLNDSFKVNLNVEGPNELAEETPLLPPNWDPTDID
ncbi:unnamed protein product [Prorocentrum cordatum]|uniref:Uncharacterized protein n=1 Tax=Prorocentrum cordatum TaxID=2364126 RepID=A0ABN9TZX7_9DINO|nr:unnamed protein product [Polarella glacialis]